MNGGIQASQFVGLLMGVGLMSLLAAPWGRGPGDDRHARRAQRHRDHRRPISADPTPPFGGEIGLNAAQSKPYWPPRVVPPKGAPNILLIMTDDVGFAAPQHLRRRDPDAGARPHRQGRAALHQLPLDLAVLADAGGADHRAQPPLGRLRRDLRGRRPAFPAMTASSARTAPRSAGSCWRTAIAPRGSARTTTRRPGPRARPARSTSGRPAWASSTSTASSAATPASGSRTCSATPRRSIPMSAIRAGT